MVHSAERLRLLFYKPDLRWPFESGHDVHTFNMMKALTEAGHEVSLITRSPIEPEVRSRLALARYEPLAGQDLRGTARLSGLQEKFRSYWGVPESHVAFVRDVASEERADAVVVSGLDVLPLLGAVSGAVRVWYAADEWFLHHITQVRPLERNSWINVHDGVLKAAYERAYSSVIDRAWVVSDADRTAMRIVAGIKGVDTLPNGVDADHYTPSAEQTRPGTAVFWGRLDFGPNIQALEWFCREVWPKVRQRRPDAEFTIIGFKLTPPVEALGRMPGVRIIPDLPDLRPEVARHAVVVLPFFSGGGIKNKLLEAAAMQKAIVCSSDAMRGLKGRPPFRAMDRPSQWVDALERLWTDDTLRQQSAAQAREWVVREHTWPSAAAVAVAGIRESLSRGHRSGGR